jgi:hypothetical protein
MNAAELKWTAPFKILNLFPFVLKQTTIIIKCLVSDKKQFYCNDYPWF